MEKEFNTSEILEAVDLLLKSNNKEKEIMKNKSLVFSEIPPNTESLITQAENYLKK
tara:strand:- start:799 stop:966 length:168 start_codon:yes stop_codon:yes gene_type:complete